MPKIELSHKKRKLLTQLISSMKSSGSREFPPGKLYGNTPVTPFSAYAFPQGEEGGRAERNYRLYCVQCHGSQGNGNGINDAAGGLSVSSRNHVYAKQMSKLTDDEIRDAITGGGDAVEKSGLMPAWGSTLANDEIAELVRYLRKLCACEYEATD
jgi:mono/diheme cytochrome c family protein